MAKLRLADRQKVEQEHGIPADRVTIIGWWPANCGCYHEQAHDDANPENVFHWHGSQPCAAHAGAGPTRAAWAACRNEDLRLGRALEVLANVVGRPFSDGGAIVTWLNERMEDGVSRKLRLVVPGVSAQQHAQAQQFLDTQFGPDAVSVVKS